MRSERNDRFEDSRDFQSKRFNRGRYGRDSYQGSSRYDRGYEDDRRFEKYGESEYPTSAGRSGGGYGDESERSYRGSSSSRAGRDMEERHTQNRDFADRYGSQDRYQRSDNNDWGTAYGRSSFSSYPSEYSPGSGMSSVWSAGSYDYNRDFNRNYGGDTYRSSSSPSYDPSYARDYERYGREQEGQGFWSQVKSFFGVGPKGYRRSDDRIREDASEALARDASVDASEIEVDVKEGQVYLRGHVPSRWMKRRAEDCVHHLSGVRDVRNELEVRAESSASGSSSTAGESSSGSSATSSEEKKRKLA